MIATIRAEFRKFITVRSTYVLMLVTLLLSVLVNFYVEGYWGQSGSAAGSLQPGALKEIVGNGVGMAALFISIIAVLQAGHEYRHNMIMYTLTANARRTQVFLSKLIVTGVFAVIFGLFVAGFSILMYKLGLSLRDATLPPQDFEAGIQMARVAIYSLIYGLIGLLFTLIFRNLIGAVVFLLMFPTTVEPLFGLLLKQNAVYLPFTTFDHILGAAIMQSDKLTPNSATVLSLVYICILTVITWFLFVRRDAN